MWLIISDTHDNIPKIRQFLDEAKRRNVTHIFHCGDVISPFALAEFLKQDCDFYGVFGNNDGEKILLNQKSSGRMKKGPAELIISKYRILMMHEPISIDAFLEANFFDFVFYGHTHKVDVRKSSKTVVLNPGDASGYLSNQATAVFLEPETGQLEVYHL
ncbi:MULTISPECIES: metallophosphoesterase [Pseudothermotoga]|jgi:hypothetical protein|uniref:Phosphoesterase n=1 Tax=Pseudothermotoga lettingae (strain ATCC BAA-301 / DSM 14385 / NBRC 107922 / TMO) TaxID=416591 RepID=A8F4A9_PSELT|nr:MULTISPECIES: metallophosphoesterase [Pseudothermotoga]ABV32993.1 phosphodiesterase, MJ0936 family [Pseudothermotoga lettingae TMO]KUK21034.1 MAG: Phosphodiesterase, family [Pseudothermotoga lettingae]MDI3494227.1 uncharacterized protein [Pseudothermotoga sp.]MDK2883999.1 uncharacterized protein [Pseudothermotoga sp.]GLI48005.1 phosphoesterase [Pseudothermotoga lettingae TMO]